MIKLEKITEKTFKKIVNMKLPSDQEKFVAPNLYSLAQAWLYQDHARPYAIMKDDEPVGFIMLDWDPLAREVGIWRLMIAQEHQNHGYGRQALEQVIELIRSSMLFDIIFLDYVPDNRVARDLYYSLGFRETGEVDDDEIIMSLPLTTNPKLGISKADEDDLEEIRKLIKLESEKNILFRDSCIDEEQLKDAIKAEHVYIFRLMGKIVGYHDENKLFMTTEHSQFMSDALSLLNDIKQHIN